MGGGIPAGAPGCPYMGAPGIGAPGIGWAGIAGRIIVLWGIIGRPCMGAPIGTPGWAGIAVPPGAPGTKPAARCARAFCIG